MEISRVGTPVLPAGWSGHIHSVFQNSCNIRLQHGQLVCLHRFDFGVLPYSLYVRNLQTQSMFPGQAVQDTPAGLVIDNRLSILWADDVELIQTKIQPGALPCWLDEERKALQEVRQIQMDDEIISTEIYGILTPRLHRLQQALLAGHQEALEEACHSCMGLGQGLTPSGDDMMLGTLAALHGYAPDLVPPLSQAIAKFLAQTNEISSSYLQLAIEGHVATPVLDVLHHLGGTWGKAKETLLCVGHSSGSDILYGILTMVKELRDKEKGRK